MSERCHWIFEEELSYFITGCIGGGIGGPEECTCDYPPSEIECERQARREAEQYIEKLIDKAQSRQNFIETIMSRNKHLCAELEHLLDLMANAHEVMRETGWQLVPAAVDYASDGILEAAAAEMESEFSAVLRNYNRIEEDRL
ncbi:hypothetical protein [Profundibacter sp.]